MPGKKVPAFFGEKRVREHWTMQESELKMAVKEKKQDRIKRTARNPFRVFLRFSGVAIIFLPIFLGIVFSFGTAISGEHRLDFRFVGNRHVSTSSLKKLAPFSTDSLTNSQLNAYSKKILEFYRDKGYYFAQIDSIRLRGTENHKKVTIFIEEGSLVRVADIRISGNKILSTQRILNRMDTRRGRVFYPDRLQGDIGALLNLYADRGYPLCKITVRKLTTLPNRKEIRIGLLVREGPPGKIESLRIVGNKVTKKRVILRELRLWPGKAFRKGDLDKIPRRLRKLPYLRLADSVTVEWDSSGNGRVRIPIREGNMAQFDGTLGYNPSTLQKKGYFTGLIDVNLQNLFGTGRTFSAFWQQKDRRSQEIKLYYEEPWVLNRPISLNGSFRQRLQDTTFIRRIWEVGSEFSALESFQLHAALGRESILPDSIGQALFRIPRSQTWRVSSGFSFDSRDDRLNARRGLFYGTSVDFLRRKTFGVSGSIQAIRRTSLEFECYWNWFGRHVWALAIHGKEVRFPGGSVPIEEQFYLGGSRTLRGYREDQFRGSRIAWSNLEYRYLTGRRSRLFLFLDVGWISNRDATTHRWNDLWKMGYGLGIRTQTALGIVGIDYGLGQGDSISQGKIHVRIMNQF